jgi:hypothetical protein
MLNVIFFSGFNAFYNRVMQRQKALCVILWKIINYFNLKIRGETENRKKPRRGEIFVANKTPAG